MITFRSHSITNLSCLHILPFFPIRAPVLPLLKIFRLFLLHIPIQNIISDKIIIRPDCRWAYPIVARVFYDMLSHSIVVPLSVMLTPFFDQSLPSYLHYASVGVPIAKEILRSITRAFDTKVIRCVPSTVNAMSDSSRMELLLQSGGMQIAYHSLLSLSGPTKGMLRLQSVNLSPTQVFFLVTAQEMCANAFYAGVNITSDSFADM